MGKNKTIELPADYTKWGKVGIIGVGGKIIILSDSEINKLPRHFKIAIKALKQLK